MGRLLPWIAAMAAATALACGPARPGYLTMATTTSVGNSGLLDVLLPAYEQQQSTKVQAHLVGSGRAIAMLASGDADVVVSHAPEAEAAALATHPRWWYRKIMFNDFVIVGPAADAAGVQGAASVEDAMRRIADSGAPFISRGDQSGTHEREQQFWRHAGALPKQDRLIVAGAGMGTTLRVASEAGAYTLTDRATFSQHAGGLRLVILLEKDPQLLNTYAVIIDMDGPRSADARSFGDWLAAGRGQDVIGGYRIGGTHVAFVPWPSGRANTQPRDLPQ